MGTGTDADADGAGVARELEMFSIGEGSDGGDMLAMFSFLSLSI